MYQGLFDNEHFIHKINFENFKKSQKVPSGEYESNILCKECDNKIIGGYEDYARRILYGGQLNKNNTIFFENRQNQGGVKTTYCKGVDYTKFKLFLLSFLWKASISQRNFFQKINLGPYQEDIRKMILKNDPKNEMDFPCCISTYANINLPKELIGQPQKYRYNNILGYTFLINKLLYIFLISNRKKPEWFSEIIINKSNEFSIVHMSEKNAKNLIEYFMGNKVTS